MMAETASKHVSKAHIIERIIVTGTLKVQSPLRIGAGGIADDPTIDTYILKDKNDMPFIPGTSLAGVLRHYAMGLDTESDNTLCPYLFGSLEEAIQSAIIIDDISLEDAEITIRDGVRIDEDTKTAVKGAKYNYEAIDRGAHGTFSMEITLREIHASKYQELHTMIGKLLSYIRNGFMLGSLTTKGFGQVQVADAKAYLYRMDDTKDVQAWFTGEKPAHTIDTDMPFEPLQDTLVITADFALRSSLIIRDNDTDKETADNQPIHAVQKVSQGEYVIPGPSIKGVLRHGAIDLLRRLGKDDSWIQEHINNLMGYAMENDKVKSRFYVKESYLRKNDVVARAQSRNRIDRFTGGTIDTALFTTEPVWQKKNGKRSLSLHYEIQKCEDWEAGLAIVLLRDLWLGRTALGGEKSIGRGTLQGLTATIIYQGKTYILDANGKVTSGDFQTLNTLAQALLQA